MLAHPAIVNDIARTASANARLVAGDCTIFSRLDKGKAGAILFFIDWWINGQKCNAFLQMLR
jgi:hypothetical protein